MRRIELGIVAAAGCLAALGVTGAAFAGTSATPRASIVFDGDSQTAAAIGGGDTLPALVQEELHRPVRNVAKSGQTLVQLAADATDVDTTVAGHGVVVVWAGTNDLALGASAGAALNTLADYTEARRAKGARVVVLTMLPRSDPGIAASYEAERQRFNHALRIAWPRVADVLVDVAADTRLGDPGAERSDRFNPDHIHLSPKGRELVADAVVPVLQDLERTVRT